MNDAWSFETKQIHAGQVPDEPTSARALPIYQTTSYTFRDTDHAASAVRRSTELGNIYTRIMNPTQAVVEERIAALEGGVGALLVRQRPGRRDARDPEHRRGRATTSCPARSLYGGTYNLFHYTLPKLGIEVSFVEDPDDFESVARGDPAEHQGVLRRDDRQPEAATSSTSRPSPASRTRPACR